jgi:cytochrome c-type biogenesis protein CcmH/NrfG
MKKKGNIPCGEIGLLGILILILAVQAGGPLLVKVQFERRRQQELQSREILISQWQRVLGEKADFRDGWLKLAVYYLEIGETQKAKEVLEKAKSLDPNYEKIKEIEGILRKW